MKVILINEAVIPYQDEGNSTNKITHIKLTLSQSQYKTSLHGGQTKTNSTPKWNITTQLTRPHVQSSVWYLNTCASHREVTSMGDEKVLIKEVII